MYRRLIFVGHIFPRFAHAVITGQGVRETKTARVETIWSIVAFERPAPIFYSVSRAYVVTDRDGLWYVRPSSRLLRVSRTLPHNAFALSLTRIRTTSFRHRDTADSFKNGRSINDD